MQQDIIWKMQHGRQLVKHKIHCGNPSHYVLQIGERSEFADKRTINSLIKRTLVEFAEGQRRFSVFRLSEAGREARTT
jgi:hypothetical protein